MCCVCEVGDLTHFVSVNACGPWWIHLACEQTGFNSFQEHWLGVPLKTVAYLTSAPPRYIHRHTPQDYSKDCVLGPLLLHPQQLAPRLEVDLRGKSRNKHNGNKAKRK